MTLSASVFLLLLYLVAQPACAEVDAGAGCGRVTARPTGGKQRREETCSRARGCSFEYVTMGVPVAGEAGAVSVGVIRGEVLSRCSELGIGVEYARCGRANVVPVFLHAGMSSRAGNMRARFSIGLGYSLFWIDDMSGTEGSGPFIGMGMGLGHEFRAAAGGGSYCALRWRI